MGVEMIEQETVITFGRLDKEAEIYTSDSTMMTKLDRKVKENPDYWKIKEQSFVSGKIVSKVYICPKKFVSLRNKEVLTKSTGNTAALEAWREKQKAGDADVDDDPDDVE